MRIINDQVKGAFSNAVNGFLLRLLQSPGTTLGGLLAGAGGILKMFEHSHPQLESWADGLLSAGVAITGINGVSHGFLNKQSGNTTTFTIPPKPPGIPPTPPAPPTPP